MSDVPRVQDLGGVLLIDARHQGVSGAIGSYLVPGVNGDYALIDTAPRVDPGPVSIRA